MCMWDGEDARWMYSWNQMMILELSQYWYHWYHTGSFCTFFYPWPRSLLKCTQIVLLKSPPNFHVSTKHHKSELGILWYFLIATCLFISFFPGFFFPQEPPPQGKRVPGQVGQTAGGLPGRRRGLRLAWGRGGEDAVAVAGEQRTDQPLGSWLGDWLMVFPFTSFFPNSVS